MEWWTLFPEILWSFFKAYDKNIFYSFSHWIFFFFLIKIWLFDNMFFWQKCLDILFFEWSIWSQGIKIRAINGLFLDPFLKNVIVYILLGIR